MPIYWIKLDVTFEIGSGPDAPDELCEGGEKRRLDGYFQNFGCTCDTDEELIERIHTYVQKDLKDLMDPTEFSLTFEEIGIIDENELQTEIYEDVDVKDSLIMSPKEQGIWYSSGRGYYIDGLDDEETYVSGDRSDEE